jgi:LAO/AO transport system kinase
VSDSGASGLAQGVLEGDRRALARAITLVESTRPDHRRDAGALLDTLLSHTGNAMRIGVSGAPGAGKSTFIEAFGLHLVETKERRVAVLAVDPSSARGGGSILGDKTRMAALARDDRAFIRPSPSGGTLGGVARGTSDAMLVCEAAGFDTVIVETVGVGQSETAVDEMVDTFVLLVAPGAGDAIQGIKRGVTETADVVAVTKADGELHGSAQQAASEYADALRFLRRKYAAWAPMVLVTSALTGDGIDDVWDAVVRHHEVLASEGVLAARRREHAVHSFWARVREQLLSRLQDDVDAREQLGALEREVAAGQVSPTTAALQVTELA